MKNEKKNENKMKWK